MKRLLLCLLAICFAGQGYALPAIVGNKLDRPVNYSNNPPQVSVTPRGIIERGYNEKFTITTSASDSNGDALNYYWEYDAPGIRFVSANTNFSQATFRTKSREGSFDITARVQDARGFMGSATTRVWVQDYLTDPPSPPRNVNDITKSYNNILMGWSVPLQGDVDAYWLYRRLSATQHARFERIATISSNRTSYLDTDVQPSTAYQYIMRAVNEGGFSDVSNAHTVTTNAPPPPAPTYANLVPGVFSLPAIGNRNGGYLRLGITVKNIGAVTAVGPWYVRITESNDPFPGGDDRLIRDLRFDDLAPNASASDTYSFRIPTAAENQTFWYFAVVDHNSRVTESIETDNSTTTQVTYRTFEPPSGFRCDQVGPGSVLCQANRDVYETFETHMATPAGTSQPCPSTTNPSCWIDDLSPGVYQFNINGEDEETNSSEATSSVTVVVSENWSGWTAADTEVEILPGSLAASEVESRQTRWGITDCYQYRHDAGGAFLSFLTSVPLTYEAPYVTFVLRTCSGITAADYEWLLDTESIITFTAGTRLDAAFQNGGVKTGLDFQEYRTTSGDCGVMRIVVPVSMLRLGTPRRFSIEPSGFPEPWFSFRIAEASPGYASAERPVEGPVAVTSGVLCAADGTTYGDFPGCTCSSGATNTNYTATFQMPALVDARPSRSFWMSLGTAVSPFNVYLNDQLLGTFNSGQSDSVSWDFGQAVLWWRFDRQHEWRYNGWWTLTADRSLWLNGTNTIRIETIGPATGSFTRVRHTECEFPNELLHPVEGFTAFGLNTTRIESHPTLWGVQAMGYSQMTSGFATDTVVWRTHPAPQDLGAYVAFTWLGAMSTGTQVHILRLNGSEVLRFGNPWDPNATWTSTDGTSRLTFRTMGTVPESNVNGIFTLVVPATMVTPDDGVWLQIAPADTGGTNEYVAVFGVSETERQRNTINP